MVKGKKKTVNRNRRKTVKNKNQEQLSLDTKAAMNAMKRINTVMEKIRRKYKLETIEPAVITACVDFLLAHFKSRLNEAKDEEETNRFALGLAKAVELFVRESGRMIKEATHSSVEFKVNQVAQVTRYASTDSPLDKTSYYG